ncbi:transposase InsO family protein [Streptomyces sp. SAI-229]
MIHSDRGSEYTSTRLRVLIGELQLRRSCGRIGSCFDNATAESSRALLKEEIGTRIRPDRATARAEFFNFIETFYNRRLRKCGARPLQGSARSRRHSYRVGAPGGWRHR